MHKVDVLRKHIGADDFYDLNGDPLLTKILEAMDEYASIVASEYIHILKWFESKKADFDIETATIDQMIDIYVSEMEKEESKQD